MSLDEGALQTVLHPGCIHNFIHCDTPPTLHLTQPWSIHHNEPYSFISFVWFDLIFRDRISLCSFGWPGVHCVDKAGLELTETAPPLSFINFNLSVRSQFYH